MTACIALNPNMVLFSQPRLLDSPTKLIVLNADEEIRRDLPKSREEALLNSIAAPRSFVVCAFGTYLKSFAWIRWQSGELYHAFLKDSAFAKCSLLVII